MYPFQCFSNIIGLESREREGEGKAKIVIFGRKYRHFRSNVTKEGKKIWILLSVSRELCQ